MHAYKRDFDKILIISQQNAQILHVILETISTEIMTEVLRLYDLPRNTSDQNSQDYVNEISL